MIPQLSVQIPVTLTQPTTSSRWIVVSITLKVPFVIYSPFRLMNCYPEKSRWYEIKHFQLVLYLTSTLCYLSFISKRLFYVPHLTGSFLINPHKDSSSVPLSSHIDPDCLPACPPHSGDFPFSCVYPNCISC